MTDVGHAQCSVCVPPTAISLCRHGTKTPRHFDIAAEVGTSPTSAANTASRDIPAITPALMRSAVKRNFVQRPPPHRRMRCNERRHRQLP
jgi:hypothetical protein